MSSMNELDQLVDDMAKGDQAKRSSLVEEINDHINGVLPWDQLTFEAQFCVEQWETMNTAEFHGNADHGYPNAYEGGYPGADEYDDGLAGEECE